MLELKPCGDKKQFLEACRRCGKIPCEAFYLYVAEDRGELLAQALFEVTSEHVRAVDYVAGNPGDFWLFDGLLRAGFHYAGEQGIEKGIIPEAFRLKHEAIFAKLNYPAVPEFNIVNFFKKYKNCASLQ